MRKEHLHRSGLLDLHLPFRGDWYTCVKVSTADDSHRWHDNTHNATIDDGRYLALGGRDDCMAPVSCLWCELCQWELARDNNVSCVEGRGGQPSCWWGWVCLIYAGWLVCYRTWWWTVSAVERGEETARGECSYGTWPLGSVTRSSCVAMRWLWVTCWRQAQMMDIWDSGESDEQESGI